MIGHMLVVKTNGREHIIAVAEEIGEGMLRFREQGTGAFIIEKPDPEITATPSPEFLERYERTCQDWVPCTFVKKCLIENHIEVIRRWLGRKIHEDDRKECLTQLYIWEKILEEHYQEEEPDDRLDYYLSPSWL